jgi:hypothetical protein
MEVQRAYCRRLLQQLPEGSTITLSVEQYRDMVTQQLELHELINHMSNFIQEHVPDY